MERITPSGGTFLEFLKTTEAHVPSPETSQKVFLFVDPQKGIQLKGFGGVVTPGEWELVYFRRAVLADESGDLDNGLDTEITVDPNYEYAVGLKYESDFGHLANWSKPLETTKILQVLRGHSLTYTPILGGGVNEADGGVPSVHLVEDTGYDPAGRDLAFLGVGSMPFKSGYGSIVWGEFLPSAVEIKILAHNQKGSNIALSSEGKFFACVTGETYSGTTVLHLFIARRKVA